MRIAWPAALALAWPLAAQVAFTPRPQSIQVLIGGKPYTAFYLAPGGNKPYLYPLSTASGAVVTRHFPMEPFPGETSDHPHQRGLFFAHGDINGSNFWATEPGSGIANMGSMKLRGAAETTPGAKSGSIHAVFDGIDAHGATIMTETRDIVFQDDPKLRVIDYDIEIRAVKKLVFADTKEGTFGIRLADSMTEDKGGRMVNAEGAETEKNVWGHRSPWVDYAGPVNGKTAGVAIFDNPANPRYPAYWHARAYGLFAANIFGVRDFTGDKTKDGSLTVDQGKSIRFRYRVVIHDGDAQAAGIAELYRQYR
jgi:hypothetical protein